MSPSPILLPPSEGKTEGGRRVTARDGVFGDLAQQRFTVREAVRSAIAADSAAAQKLLGVRGANLERALSEWASLEAAPCLPAAERYSGVVWSALAPDSLNAEARRRLNRRVLIASGLWGLVAATDPLPAYRLKMGARVPPVGALAAFWRPHITPLIAARAGRGWVIDLLPDEHAAAIDFADLGAARHLRVEILDRAARAIGHAGKSLKGRLARAIIEADARTPEAVGALEVDGLGPGAVERTRRHGPATVRFAAVPGQESQSIH